MIASTDREIAVLKEGGRKLAEILRAIGKKVAPGVASKDIDALAEKLIIEAGGRPSFKGYKTSKDSAPFPATVCVSINEEVVHGIPSGRKFKEGDIVGLDIGMSYKGIYTDTAITVPVGEISGEALALLNATEASLGIGISACRAGGNIGDIGEAIQKYVEKFGFGVVRELVGHGVGSYVHEEPQIPNFGKKGTGAKIVEGMVLALEPMVTLGSNELAVKNGGWTWYAADGKPAAHFEHTILVTRSGPEILTK